MKNNAIKKPIIATKRSRTIISIGCSEALKFAIKTSIRTSAKTVWITIFYQYNLQISQLEKQLS